MPHERPETSAYTEMLSISSGERLQGAQLYPGSKKSGPDALASCVSFLLVSALRKKTGLSFVQMRLYSMKYLWQWHSSKESEGGMMKPKSATF